MAKPDKTYSLWAIAACLALGVFTWLLPIFSPQHFRQHRCFSMLIAVISLWVDLLFNFERLRIQGFQSHTVFRNFSSGTGACSFTWNFELLLNYSMHYLSK